MTPVSRSTAPPRKRREALAYCERLARAHSENFTVGSLLFPRRLLPHLYVLYAYCRTVDDLGDESSGDREAALADWERQLNLCFAGEAAHPVYVALRETLQEHPLPIEPFRDLIEANRRDQFRHRYETFPDLLDYCAHSANPCGRLVLALLDCLDEDRARLSDFTCTALQLTNFWQDIAADWRRGRLYLPLEDLRRFSVTEEGIAAGRVDEGFRSLMRFEVERTRTLFARGRPLRNRVPRSVRVDIDLFSRGGLRILDAIEAAGYDVFRRRPRLSSLSKAGLFLRAICGAAL